MTVVQRVSSSTASTSKICPRTNKESIGQQIFEGFKLTVEIILFLIQFWYIVANSIYRLFVRVPEKSVRHEIVLITGAGHGIGREIALQYASEGATVVCWDINKKQNLETVQEIASLGYPKAHAYECNVANREQVMEIAEKVQREVGEIGILINNAGIMPCHSFLEHTPEEIEKVINVNLMSHYWTLKAFLPSMLKNNHGHIVAISSAMGLSGLRNLVPYCTTKHAIRGLMEALCLELHADPNCRIRFTTIYPLGVDTGLAKNPVMRFPNVTQLLKPRIVAKCIMSAQRRNMVETTVPRFYLSLVYIFRLFPTKANKALIDFLDTYIDSDL